MERFLIKDLQHEINNKVKIQGWISKIRKLKWGYFVILRDRTGCIQVVLDNSVLKEKQFKLETVVTVKGVVKESNNKISNIEIQGEEFLILNEVTEELPIEINKGNLEVNMDTMLNNRVLSLRHEKKRSIFKVQNLIVQGFREYLISKGFLEIFTPKLVSQGAEGGTEVFEVKYFESKAYLAQSPQFYKQMMVASGAERVFEVGAVYRAEEHNTTRHLNEYISMDLEIGFIESEEELMNLEEELLKYILNKISSKGEKEIEILGANIPKLQGRIPRMKLSEAIEILKKKYNKTDLEGDLDPEGERLICEYAKKEFGCEFIFLTHYPRKKRPMYTMALNEVETRSFDLLFRGIEITTGGQRIHKFEELIKNIEYKELNPENYKEYTKNFKYGMPPHGGLAIGLERITAKLLELDNVREGSLFPRDRNRLTP
ncbi:MAG: aspartate--tRNA(Asn) ligase [Clostridium sp.]